MCHSMPKVLDSIQFNESYGRNQTIFTRRKIFVEGYPLIGKGFIPYQFQFLLIMPMLNSSTRILTIVYVLGNSGFCLNTFFFQTILHLPLIIISHISIPMKTIG